MDHRIACISQGKLHLIGSKPAEESVSSDFVRDLKKRLQVIESRASIRNGSGAAFMRGGLPMQDGPSVEDTFTSEFSCVSGSSQSGEICYGIDAGEVRALFIYEIADRYERRVYHGPNHRFAAISTRQTSEGPEWLVAMARDHGGSRIGLIKPQSGGGIQELTEGDSLDSYPAWAPSAEDSFVYQTSGIGRHHSSNAWEGLGPASIQKVNMQTGEMQSVAEDDRFDFLCPSYGPDGVLYYLKRPYEPFHRPSFWQFLLDIVLYPFRLVRAFLAFLNVFSMFFSGKPLQTAGLPPRRDGPDPKSVFLHGRWINMEKKMRQAAADELKDFLPKNWELIARSPDGEKVICNSVMAYTIASDGSIYYSNGKAVFAKAGPDSPVKKISDLKLVTSLAAVA
ncbi:hypothetical protein [Prosthecobacter sp.]|uniref:hypothetical protein n=1 Tax=Prosthecobacter sp. TaxID=1965333 RepID=UPI003784110A